MNILIGGGGKVGYNLAKLLSNKHNITIIDKDKEKIEYISETLDVLCINGDLKDAITYQNLEENYDYYLAVTNNDEINLISSLIVEDFSKIKNKIARINNPSYSLTSLYEKININFYIYSNIITAANIERLLYIPQANNIKDLPYSDDIFLISIESEIETDSNSLENDFLKVISIARGEEIFFCNKCEIKKGDLVYILGNKNSLKECAEILAPNQPKSIKNVIIFGANELSVEIAKHLNNFNLNITMLEQDSKTAYKAIHLLPENITVLNVSFDDENFFKSEHLEKNDMSIATLKSDETNIIKSLIAKKYGIKKTVCINNNPYYHDLMTSLHLPIIRGPKMNTVYKILEEIDSQDIIFERFFMGFKGKIFIKKAYNNQKISLPKESVKIIILRENRLLEITEEFEIKQDDIILYFNFSGNRKWIENL